MDITYLGAGSVKLTGRMLSVVCDPFDESVGLGKAASKADVVTLSGPDGHASIPGAMEIDIPGEYEVKSTTITGVPARLHIDESGTRGTVYAIDIDGVNVVVTGNIAGKLDDDQVEKLGQVDVLVVPVGGHGLTLDAAGAAAVVSQLEPSYVIPVHFADDATTYPMPQDGVETFLKEMGAQPEPEPKFRVVKQETPAETQVVVLTRVGQ